MRYLIATLVIFFPAISYACSCVYQPENIDATYSRSTGIYWAVISKIEATDIDEGRANLSIELTILKTYKGDSVKIISAKSQSSFSTIETNGDFISSETSCDSKYYINKKYLIALDKGEAVNLGQCSQNILLLNTQNLQRLEELQSSNKSMQPTAKASVNETSGGMGHK